MAWYCTASSLTATRHTKCCHSMATGRLSWFLLEASTLEQTAESTKAPFSVGGAIRQAARKTFRVTADPRAIASSDGFIFAATAASDAKEDYGKFVPTHTVDVAIQTSRLCVTSVRCSQKDFSPEEATHNPSKKKDKAHGFCK